MCCCGKPTVNGQPGYRWQPNDAPSIRQPHAPELEEGDQLLADCPGRCGRGIDSHCHHYRVVAHGPFWFLLVQHGGGVERFRLGKSAYLLPLLQKMSEDDLYWILNGIYWEMKHVQDIARNNERTYWQTAAAEKRIKTRTRRERGGYRFTKVWVEPSQAVQQC